MSTAGDPWRYVRYHFVLDAIASAFETPAASTDGGEEPWLEVEDARVKETGAWARRGVCDRVTAWAPKWAMPAMVALAACGVEPELPTADEFVHVYDARTGDWSEAAGAELEVGDTWLNDGRLHRWTDDGVDDRGEATVEDLAAADATWTAEAATRVPGTDEWVLVLGEADEAGHWKLAAVERPGTGSRSRDACSRPLTLMVMGSSRCGPPVTCSVGW